jgi:hypothetical protein
MRRVNPRNDEAYGLVTDQIRRGGEPADVPLPAHRPFWINFLRPHQLQHTTL